MPALRSGGVLSSFLKPIHILLLSQTVITVTNHLHCSIEAARHHSWRLQSSSHASARGPRSSSPRLQSAKETQGVTYHADNRARICTLTGWVTINECRTGYLSYELCLSVSLYLEAGHSIEEIINTHGVSHTRFLEKLYPTWRGIQKEIHEEGKLQLNVISDSTGTSCSNNTSFLPPK